MSSKLEHKIALVVGGASGIGRATAELFHEHGAFVIVADRDEAGCRAVAETLGPRAQARALDVTSEDNVQAVVEATIQAHGRIDILVNSAGILTQSTLVDMPTATFDGMIEVNLRGTFLTCRHVAPHMVARQSGRIINVASQLAQKGGVGLSHYSAAKAGIIGFTKSIARELAVNNVLANAIAPGPIMTTMLSGLSDAWVADKQAELPLGRFGEAREVAPSALMLAASPDGDLYVGQTLGPNSGDVM
ncbi:SDR family NAD(P)-dependent oxidoreductase [Salinisphaera sp. Q1T1-3]|uniref:SDR family NAD(P)-dependent oxidoreductase n=1 Tax=Salinisphaera sp. Q1T1-3 TaxID=2321229 RepID=UPI0018F4E605|nr:SDR family NAD(P)-dependent oxidoreductase [Salinisphaera sp. Q1T1-3]